MIKLSATVPLQYDTVFSPFAACEFDQGLEWLNLNHFDGIEVCIAQPNTVDVPQLKQKLKQYQLTVSTISTGQVFSDSLSCCAAYAQKQGVRLMVEPINQQETCLLNGTTETLEFLADCPFDNVGVLLDTFHSNLEDTSIEEAIHALGAKLFHVHFADSNRGLPGTGEINFLVVVKALIEHQFQGFVSLETLSIPNKEIVKRESYSRLAQCFQ
ncbi:MAG: sugar phosphate isomerase/epimerase [Anaerosporomusa subterranea]|nr:sugar phosphate isomerase/epimerase [Anaerosporomusa subterranea]